MEISELTLKLIIVLFPGVIASVIFEKLTIHSKWTPFQFVYNSILFGSLSYILAHLIFVVINFFTCGCFEFLNNTISNFNLFWMNLSAKEIHLEIVIWASITSLLISLCSTALDNNKVLNKLAKNLGITNKYGDESLYYKFLNSRDINEIYFRDNDEKLTYHGVVDSYSEGPDSVEILLYDVVVYDTETSYELYRVKFIYLCKKKDNISIENPIT